MCFSVDQQGSKVKFASFTSARCVWSLEDSRREYETAQTNRSTTHTVKCCCCTRSCRIQTKVKSTEWSGSRLYLIAFGFPGARGGGRTEREGEWYSRVLHVNMLVGSTYVHIRLYKSTTAPSRRGGGELYITNIATQHTLCYTVVVYIQTEWSL